MVPVSEVTRSLVKLSLGAKPKYRPVHRPSGTDGGIEPHAISCSLCYARPQWHPQQA